MDMELWKSSCDDMHWQQGKCYIQSWQFWPYFNSCWDCDFTTNIYWNNMDQTWPYTWLVCSTSWDGIFCGSESLEWTWNLFHFSQQNSAGAWYIACNNPSVIYNQNAYNMVLCSWIHWLCIGDKVIQLKCFILELERERVVGERLSWLIWATFDLEHEAWLVSHEAYFNLAKTRWSTRFLLRLYEHISSPLIILGVHCLQFCVNIPGSFENFPGIATVWICNKYITFFVILWFMPWGNWVPKILILWYSLLSIRD